MLTLAAVVLAGLAAALVTLDALRCQQRLEREFGAANEVLILTFSRAARSALIRGESDFLQSAARMLIAGGAKTVQIVIGHEIVLSERTDELTPELALLEFDESLKPSGVYARFERCRLLDVVRPLLSSDRDQAAIGYIRVLFGTEIVAGQIQSRALAGSGIALALWGAVLAGLWLFQSRRHRRTSHPPRDWLECGGLAISRTQKRVRVFDVEITLTPKQFELLFCLAGEPGRVFSDGDLLDCVWTASTYANASDVKQCVYTLRKRLAEAVADPHALIETVTGHGYRLVPPGDEQRLKPI